MVTVSDDLVWECVRKHNSALVGRKSGPKFTKESCNLMNVSSKKYSGYLSKGVGLEFAEKQGQATLKIKTKTGLNKPKKATRNVNLNIHGRGTRLVNKTVIKLVEEQFYRPDLSQAALARVTKQAKADRKAIALVEYKPKSRSNK